MIFGQFLTKPATVYGTACRRICKFVKYVAVLHLGSSIDVVTGTPKGGWQEGQLPPWPSFSQITLSLLNPISTRGADYAHKLITVKRGTKTTSKICKHSKMFFNRNGFMTGVR